MASIRPRSDAFNSSSETGCPSCAASCPSEKSFVKISSTPSTPRSFQSSIHRCTTCLLALMLTFLPESTDETCPANRSAPPLVTEHWPSANPSSRPNRDMSSTINGHHQEVDRPEERGAVRPTHWLGVSQARTRASYFPHSATPVVCAVSVCRPPACDPQLGKP